MVFCGAGSYFLLNLLVVVVCYGSGVMFHSIDIDVLIVSFCSCLPLLLFLQIPPFDGNSNSNILVVSQSDTGDSSCFILSVELMPINNDTSMVCYYSLIVYRDMFV